MREFRWPFGLGRDINNAVSTLRPQAKACATGGHIMMPTADQLVHTYSIVARDPDTGQLGVAVQSHYFSVGSVVTWAEAGVGAVATQAFADPAYGKLGLDLMRAQKSAPDALAGLLAADPMKEVRQVAMVDRARTGRSAHRFDHDSRSWTHRRRRIFGAGQHDAQEHRCGPRWRRRTAVRRASSSIDSSRRSMRPRLKAAIFAGVNRRRF